MKRLPDWPLLTRRAALLGAASLACSPGPAVAAPGLEPGRAFSFDLLVEAMQRRAGEPWSDPPPLDARLARITYDEWRAIAFDAAAARWSGPEDRFRIDAFHPGWLFNQPVRLFDVTDGRIAPILFGAADFRYPDSLAGRIPPGDLAGVAGFRLEYPLNRPEVFDELVAFLGASYFRALGRGSAYGLSARGLALNTAAERAEEFPAFTAFYLERPAPGTTAAAFSAALEGPSVAGAYRFHLRPGQTTVMEVTARLFFRAAVAEIGVAPLTSMFLFDDKNHGAFDDHRPRVHDSNGLRMAETSGDVLWRPLNNPGTLANSYFTGPKTRFGLHQRGRAFESYADAEAHYERRPSLDVEPMDDWGPGAIRLIEIPTRREIHDNIVAYWLPESRGIAAGEARTYRYRLHWGDLDDPPAADAAAEVVRFSAGLAGVSGVDTPEDARKFVVDFSGGRLAGLPADAQIEAVVTHSAGTVISQTLELVPEAGVWRLVIDLAAPDAPLVELSAHLAGFGRKLTETWLYQWTHPG